MNSTMMDQLVAEGGMLPHPAGERAFGAVLIAAGFPNPIADERCRGLFGVRQKFSTLAAYPELIIRPVDLPVGQEADADLMADFTDELLYLDDEHGLRTPGLSMAREARHDSQGMLQFIVASRIEGLDFNKQLSRIPEQIAIKGCRAVMSYYGEAVRRGDGVRFCDLKAQQLLYGQGQLHADEPDLYFTDLDPYAVRITSSVDNNGFEILRAAAGYNIEASIELLERAYSKPFYDLREEQETVKARFDAVSLLTARTCLGEEFALAA